MLKVTESSAVSPPNFTVTSRSSTSGSPTLVSISLVGATISATTSGSASSGMTSETSTVTASSRIIGPTGPSPKASSDMWPVFLADLRPSLDTARIVCGF